MDINELYEADRMRVYGLIGNLPRSSRLYESELGGPEFTFTDQLISTIEFLIRSYLWAMSKDSKTGMNRPELMLPEHVLNAQEEVQRRIEERNKYYQVPENVWAYINGEYS